MMLGKRALVALAFVLVGSLADVGGQNFASTAYLKSSTMIFAHVGGKMRPGIWFHNSIVHDSAPQAVKIALHYLGHLRLGHIVLVKCEQFFYPVVLHVPTKVNK